MPFTMHIMIEKGFHRYRLGIVGNCSYIAYIDDQAAVQWLCMPRFDSSFIFAPWFYPYDRCFRPLLLDRPIFF